MYLAATAQVYLATNSSSSVSDFETRNIALDDKEYRFLKAAVLYEKGEKWDWVLPIGESLG